MTYRYSPYSSACYATMLRRDTATGNLTWDSSKGRTVLVVQCGYGRLPYEDMEEICSRLGQISLEEDAFNEVLPGVWARFVTPGQKVKNKGCPLRGEASSYTVFCCEDAEDGSGVLVHAPQTEKRTSLNIPAEIIVEIKEDTEMRSKGFLLFGKSEEVATGYCRVEFPKDCPVGYVDGDIFYSANDRLTVPVTRKMMEQGTVYVKTGAALQFGTYNEGLKLTVFDASGKGGRR